MEDSVMEVNTKLQNLKYLLTTAFLSGLSLSRPLWKIIENSLMELVAEENSEVILAHILQSTFAHPLNLKYPRNYGFQINVLSWLRDIWTKKQLDIGSLSHILTNFSSSSEKLEIGYKSYRSGTSDCFITILESYEGIARGTTGLSSWGAAQVLSAWLSENPEIISKKRVLELGSGIGFTAVSLLASNNFNHQPSRYIATDYHPHILSILHHNLALVSPSTNQNSMEFLIEMNSRLETEELQPGEFRQWQSEGNISLQHTEVMVQQLDWRNHEIVLPDCDVILGADVVYASHLFPDLVRVIRRLLLSSETTLPLQSSNCTPECNCTARDLTAEEHLMEGTKTQNSIPNNQQTKMMNAKSENPKKEPDCSTSSSGDLSPEETSVLLNSTESSIGRRGRPKAYIACTRRSQETLSRFLSEVTKQELLYQMVFQATIQSEDYLFSYNECYKPVRIYEIRLDEG